MSHAIFAGRAFRLDPTSVTGGFRIKTNTTNTVGGRVVHVYGVTWDNLTIIGSFGRGGYEEQAEFLNRMVALADRQINDPKASPVQFVWPEKGWRFSVYLLEAGNPDGARSVEISPGIVAPKWRLTLFVANDSGTLKDFAVSNFIERFSRGLGWKQTIYNGPLADITGSFALTHTPEDNPNFEDTINVGDGTRVR